MKKRLLFTFLLAALLYAAIPFCSAAEDDEISILFTHDLHSHLETKTVTTDGVAAQRGGFAKLKTAADEIRAKYPGTLLLDAGDFSMGTPYQTIFSTDAAELRLMGLMGYDAVTLGNHEFDYRGKGLTGMLHAAAESGEKLPLLLEASIDWKRTLADPTLAEDAALMNSALERCGTTDYTLMEKGGKRIAIFGIYGKEADSFAPLSGLYFYDPIERAKQVVAQIQADGGADLIICLSHSGTSSKPEESEDELLAKAVPEIDLIISGHSHTKLEEPIIVGKTVIASSGSYSYDLGHLVLKKNGDRYDLKSYGLIPLDGTVQDDAVILDQIEAYKTLVSEHYMAQFGYRYDEVLAKSDFAFTPVEIFGATQGEDTLANLISDSYIYAVKKAEGDDYETVNAAVVPAGVVRGSFGEGEITAADVFNVSSLGIGPDGVPGYPLVSVYVTGAELKTMAEVDISVSELMPTARLYISGLTYTYNPNRLFLNRVTDVKLVSENGIEQLSDDRLYRIVGGLYSCQMLGAVEEKSHGLLKIVPKDKNGNPISDFERHIVYDGGRELKEWVALARYLSSFQPENGVPKIPLYYAQVQGRKIAENSGNLIDLLKHPNAIFFMAAGALIAALLVAVLIILLVVKLVRRREKRSRRGGK